MSTSNIPREDLLILLASFGVSLPLNTKIPTDDLHKRLSHTLDAAQQFTAIISECNVPLPLLPTKYPSWAIEKPLTEASARGNMIEYVKAKTSHKGMTLSTAKEDTFAEVRMNIRNWGKMFECGERHHFLMDKMEMWGVYIHVVSVHEIKEAPLFIVLYKEVHAKPNQPITEQVQTLREADTTDDSDTILVSRAWTTELERLTILKLLRLNSKRLSSDYHPIDKKVESKYGLKVSFALPLGPLSLRNIGKLTTNLGCEVCGDTTSISRCVQCLSVAYCGTTCQKSDWPNHKVMCRSVKGGTWRTVNIDMSSSKSGQIKVVPHHAPFPHIPRPGPTHNDDGLDPSSSSATPTANIHGSKIFLVKLQISLFDTTDILIYDRQRSFQAIWYREHQQGLFDEVEDMLGGDLKMFRWARKRPINVNQRPTAGQYTTRHQVPPGYADTRIFRGILKNCLIEIDIQGEGMHLPFKMAETFSCAFSLRDEAGTVSKLWSHFL
ncbi:hypothetical protein M413DRAFT_415454 [Hebeloma cylindrosporum]|uniref:MYND-type domain-containing protein n=1 Tax=Hebeloma cylindrosporum TaxID=76867 RepID=A0A0C2YEQ9_HEBCY|nr:hypothetical protein M413DRAFT_415454 [Hebeloma cylindrosporum h7]